MWGIGKVIDVLEIIYNEAEKEWCDDSKYREMLSELYVKLEDGEIGEEEYEELEEEIILKLREIRNYKREHGIEGD